MRGRRGDQVSISSHGQICFHSCPNSGHVHHALRTTPVFQCIYAAPVPTPLVLLCQEKSWTCWLSQLCTWH